MKTYDKKWEVTPMKYKDHLFKGLHIYIGRFRVRVYPDHVIGVAI